MRHLQDPLCGATARPHVRSRQGIALAVASSLATFSLGCASEDTAHQQVGGDPEGSEDVSHFGSALYNGDTPATEVIERAKYWFDEDNALVPYTNGYCPITGDSSCYRDPDGNHYYRRDCSGLASMALHMNHSATTADFKNGAFGFERLTNDADAKPGDLVLSTDKNGSGYNHTIIFEKWIDSNSWKGYDGGDMPVRHPTFYVSKSGGTITNMDRKDYYGRTFHVFRTPHVIQEPICTPKTCSQVGCGSLTASENCGTALNCGCASGQTCEDGQCVTTPTPSTSYAKPWWTGTLRNGGQCAQPAGSDPLATGAVVAMNTCDKDFVRQSWYLTGNRGLKNLKSGLCIEPDSVEQNQLTRQKACGGSEQIWRFYDVQIVNGQTGHCLDVPAADYHSDQTVIQWPCHGGANQLFRYLPHTGELKINGWCLDAGSAANLTKVTLQPCDGTKSQQWGDDHGGFVSAVATSFPRCLALEGGATAADGAKLIVSNCDDSVPQMWALRGQIHHYDSSFCLKNSSVGPEVKLVDCDSSQPEQRFTFWMNP